MNGDAVWDSGTELEREASLLGHYPDSRSGERSIEAEGVVGARLFGDDIFIAGSERGSFIAVYRISDPSRPELLKILPTGGRPEGIVVVGGRADGKKLIVTSNEGDGTINIYSVWDYSRSGDSLSPTVFSREFAWSALSGFSSDGTHIFAIPDDARSPSVIWKLDLGGVEDGQAEIVQEIPLAKEGRPAAYDLEGICWTNAGFWLAAEGAKSSENFLIFASHDGSVMKEYAISGELLDKYGDPKNYGFEGLAVTKDGKKIYVALQRGFATSQSQSAILLFDVESQEWTAAWYPLDKHSGDPAKFWMGISDVAMAGDSTLLVVERDKGMGGTAEVKKVYAVDLNAFKDNGKLEKKLAFDILAEKGLLLEKVESLCLVGSDMWIATDNDGAGWTRMLNLGPLPR
jgi:hypothetical protein